MMDPNFNNQEGGHDRDQGAQNQYEGDKQDALMSWESGQDYDSGGYDNSYDSGGYSYDDIDSN